ncbi:MAG: M20/M25/M40 family metallo-hydrolase, partial [Methylophilaceae bacterium]
TITNVIEDITKVKPTISTSGGTSDGRFISKLCDQVVEFGPINASIHKINEHVALEDIDKLKDIYKLTLTKLLT